MLTQIIATGILMGFVYSLVAVGLTLTWGVLDIINFAHGEFLMISMYSAFWIYTLYNVDPLLSLPLTTIMAFGIGYGTYKVIIRKVVDAPGLTALLATFGFSLLLRNLAQFLWSPNYRFINQSFVADKKLTLGPIIIGLPQVFAAIGSILMTLAIFYFIERTKTGRAIQATALDKHTALLMGIPTEKIYALTFGISGACVGVAGALMSTFFPIHPQSGALYSLLAFVIVALGGFGNIKGALYSGILIGITEAVGGFLLGTQFKYAIVFLMYLVVIQIRPKGLFGW
ncbi:amino acid/amide ABC transporter membrane protein 1, HAAT family (TC 3.A.1.4.-) [Geosporobacter subterraneus DSM 17957]|uniref:Amino acid/amide ABC transporter membrane protein 1, HAAT family (TC 3.A.1.4.-) n=1 Tax=Geosporobacter subterraneus DSM 17957 TaxID=1121919 RepID=A0A1M6D4K7_9FIRM|nr:branched-chain amino acid ABC transporter permease [Geosporobacter subterraneus]SHI68023.1 amino acid/amide ABC transporter membrane protein 1, HAAT family (TC 3.A.1.4.-) [Geosporobacter subterraneus DSM 17957]